MSEPLPVDESHVRRAVAFYRDRIAEGYRPGCAYAMSIAYLRRKTGLSIPLAMASLDEVITP